MLPDIFLVARRPPINITLPAKRDIASCLAVSYPLQTLEPAYTQRRNRRCSLLLHNDKLCNKENLFAVLTSDLHQ